MGFPAGFLGGVTLTGSILYLSVAIHHQTRLRQAGLIAQQEQILRNIIDPQPPAPPPTAREVRAGIIEQAKDRWNAEIEGLVKRIHNTDWNEVRAQWEGKVADVVGTGLEKVRESSGEATKIPPAADTVRREG